MTELKTCAAYIRVSTDGQMDLSPESQLDEIIAYAKKNHMTLSREYIFMEQEGVSGKRAEKREAFQRMIATAKQDPKPFDCILVWKFSRFARNQDEATFYKGMLRKKYGIDVTSVSEPIMEGMYGRLIEMIIEWQDEFYSYNLAGEVRRGMKKRIEKGLPNSIPPLGYNHNKGSIPTINLQEAEIVRLMFQMYLDGHDINYITRYLNDHGIKTKRGSKWISESVTYVLENPYYIGKLRWNRRESSVSSKLKDPSEWIISDGAHEPLINLEDFEAVQERRRISKLVHSKYQHPISHTKHWLSGMVKCSICGKSLAFKKDPKNRCDGFQCLGYHTGLHSESQYISEKKLATAVLASLREVLSQTTSDYTLVVKHSTNEDIAYKIALDELEKLSMKEARIKAAYMDGIDTLDEYRANKDALQKRRDELNAIIHQTQNVSSAKPEELKNSVKNVLEILEASEIPFEKKAQALRSIVSKIDFDKLNQKLTVHYYLST